ncbi:MAG: FUSC family membrane protein [Burkholderiales bacterium]
MDISTPRFERFIYSQHFYSGVRRATGILLPVMVFGGIFGLYAEGLIATFGALCVALIDQPGPHEHRGVEMLGGTLLSTLTVVTTGLATSHPILIWFVVIGQCFAFSMLSVYGKKGSQIGFACLLVMTITLHSPLTTDEVWHHALISFGGGLFYTVYSYSVSQAMNMREKAQSLSIALFATAQYIRRRADMYDLDNDLDEGYRKLIECQAAMTEQHQAARDMVLRGLSTAANQQDPRRVMLWNIFIDMLGILDSLVATHTDYALLRRELANSDALLFMRDALYKMSLDIDRIALAVSRNRAVRHRSSVKAEIRALEYEVDQMRRANMQHTDPDLYGLCVQILRRLRNTANIVDHMYSHLRSPGETTPLAKVNMDNSLGEFLSRQQFRVRMITSNLRLDSPTCRYALRVALAGGIAMALSMLIPALSRQGFWILLTVLVILKPGFALTRQRNGWRLVGTLIGCAVAFAILRTTNNVSVLFAAMVLATIIGGSLLLINFMAASAFNTVAVLLAFHFLTPSSFLVIGDRALDTVIGSLICVGCSYFLPWWEARFMPSLARAAVAANREYLRTGLALQATRATPPAPDHEKNLEQADLAWRLARKNVQVAFSNFAEAFYRMMREPRTRQKHVAKYNDLMIQCHMLASQISAIISLGMGTNPLPAPVAGYLQEVVPALTGLADAASPPPLTQAILEGLPAELAYPMRQMQKSLQLVQSDIGVVRADPLPA